MRNPRNVRPATLCAGMLALSVAVVTPVAAAHSGHNDGTSTSKSKTQSVDIRFAAVAGTTPVACGKPIAGLGKTLKTAQLADLRFYVSEAKLLRSDGRAVSVKLAADSLYRVTRGNDRVTLIDLENGAGSCTSGTRGTNPVVRGTVPQGKYVGVQVTVGVPFALNHTDVPAAPRPLNVAAMSWSWQAGRKFAKIDVTDPGGPTGSWTSKQFNVHLGSTGCAGNPATGQTVSCRAANRSVLKFARFNPQRQQIAVDLRTLLAGNDVTANLAGAPGCMSGPTDPECNGVLSAFGIDWRADGNGTGKSPSGSAQRAFRVTAR